MVTNLNPLERAALAMVYALSIKKYRETLEQSDLISIHQIFSMDVLESLKDKKLITFGQNTVFQTPEGEVKVPFVLLTDFGRAFAQKYGSSSEVLYVPQDLKNYKYVPTFLLEKALNAILSLLYFRKETNVIDKFESKVSHMTPSLWVSEWEQL